MCFLLLGTKADLRDNQEVKFQLVKRAQQVISSVEAEILARSVGASKYIECSAKTGADVQKVRVVLQVDTNSSCCVGIA